MRSKSPDLQDWPLGLLAVVRHEKAASAQPSCLKLKLHKLVKKDQFGLLAFVMEKNSLHHYASYWHRQSVEAAQDCCSQRSKQQELDLWGVSPFVMRVRAALAQPSCLQLVNKHQ